MTARQTFGKTERLCSNRLIAGLFENGNSFYSPLFRVTWIISPAKLPSPAQIAISIPKKNIRSAVYRNLVRRRIREAYRKNKQVLYDCLNEADVQVVFAVIYRQNTIADYKTAEKYVIAAIQTLCGLVTGTNKSI